MHFTLLQHDLRHATQRAACSITLWSPLRLVFVIEDIFFGAALPGDVIQHKSLVRHVNGFIKVGFSGSGRIGVRVAWSAELWVGILVVGCFLSVWTSSDAVASSDAGA